MLILTWSEISVWSFPGRQSVAEFLECTTVHAKLTTLSENTHHISGFDNHLEPHSYTKISTVYRIFGHGSLYQKFYKRKKTHSIHTNKGTHLLRTYSTLQGYMYMYMKTLSWSCGQSYLCSYQHLPVVLHRIRHCFSVHCT